MKIFLYIFILVFASNTSFGDIPYPFKKSDEIKSGIIIDHNRKTCFKAWAPEKYFDINKYSKCIEGYVMLLEITGHDKIGLYNIKYKHSNDYDFFYRLINNKKFYGRRTLRTEVLGKFRDGGFSSKLKFFDILLMELKIRFDNNQNFFDLLIIFFGRCIFKIISLFK